MSIEEEHSVILDAKETKNQEIIDEVGKDYEEELHDSIRAWEEMVNERDIEETILKSPRKERTLLLEE
jgi:hypothetical protein